MRSCNCDILVYRLNINYNYASANIQYFPRIMHNAHVLLRLVVVWETVLHGYFNGRNKHENPPHESI